MAFGQTPLSTTNLGANQFPVSAVAVPNEAGGNLTALEGGPESTDGNGNKTAPVSMYVKDGGDVTQGTSTDANTVNSIMGRLTKIRDLLNATLTVGGTITEANSASIKSDVDAINTAIGTISDATWSGSGNGSEIAILKKIVAELAATLTVSGTVTANAGTGTFTNQQSNIAADYDSGAGTQNLTMFGVALPASGGAVSGGTSTNPIRTDTTGTTTQPVSGTVTVQQSTAANLKVDLSGTSANSTAIKVDGSGVTQPVSGTITANAGTGSFNDASVGSTGLSVPASASYVGGNKSGNLAGISLDGSGNLNVNVAAGGGSGGTSSSFNSTFPSTGTAVGASDGANMKSLLVDGSGFLKVNVSAGGGSGGTSSSFGSALPATGTAIGFTDGTNMQAGKAFDADTGAGTEYVVGAILRKSGSGGSVEAGTSSNPLRTDPTGTTTQPVSGTVSITANSAVNVAQVAGTTTDTNSGNKSAGTQRIVIATDQPQLTNALKVDGSGVTQPVSGTVTANAGTGSFTVAQTTGSNLHTVIDAGSAVIGHVIADSGSTTAVTQATASNLNAQVVGSVASGASNAGNPVKDGGVFNTTQPTVTTGQVVDAQYSARGAAIVATGVDAFAVNASQSGTWNVTNVSGTVSLPTGASTSAKQPALGTAGSASADVITVQGVASMTAIKTDGSGVTQPVSGTVSITANSAVNVAQVAGTTTDTNSGNKSAGTQRIVLATDQPQLTNALKVDGSGVTQPVSGTVTANAGTGTFTNQQSNITTDYDTGAGTQTMTMFGLALPASGGSVAGGTATNPVQVSLANTAANSTAVKVDGSAVTQPVSGTVSITSNSAVNVAQVGGTTADTNSGNKSAGTLRMVLATDQPALTNKLLVTPDSVALPANQSVNVTQFGSSNTVTGTGTSGSGIPRVTVSNDSQLQVWDGTAGPVAVKAANTSPTLSDKSLVHALSPVNTGLPVNLPGIVQSTNNKSSGSVASLAKAFVSNNVAGNSIIVVCGVGNGTAPTISDTNSNTYTQIAQVANGTAFNVAVFLGTGATQGTGIASGANTVTVNNGGSTASIAMEIYEVSGLIAQVQAQPDQTATNTGSSGTASTSALSALSPNEYAFAAIGVGTAAQTITAGSGWTNDSGQQNPTTPSGLFSFVSISQFLGSLKAVTPQATFTSEPWAIAVATFRPVILGIEGTINTSQLNGTTIDTNSGNKSAGTQRIVIATDQPQLTNALKVDGSGVTQPVSGTVSITSNSSVNMAQVAGTTTDTNSGNKSAGTLRVVLATDQPALTNKLLVTPDSVALPANQSVNISQINAVTPLMGNGGTGTGSQRVTIASDNTAFTVNAAQSGTWTVQPGNTANTTAWLTQPVAGTTGGTTPFHLISAATTNANNVKASAGTLYGYTLSNTNSSARYFRLYNLAGSPTVGSSTIKHTVQIPANATVIHVFPVGMAFGTGIAISCTGAMADADTTAIGAGDVSIDLDYL